MHHTAFVPYSVTAGCSLTGNTHELLPVVMICCLTVVTFDPGIFPSAAIVLLGTCYDPILSIPPDSLNSEGLRSTTLA